MAVLNGERYVGEAVRSVLAQTYDDFELIVIDDGSTDGTVATITAIADPRIRIISQLQSGVAPARNRGIAESTGELLAFIDHDDIWFPDKLETQVPLFGDPTVGVVGSFMTYLAERGPTRAMCGEATDGQEERIATGRLMPFPLSSMIARSDLVRDLGEFDAGLAHVAQVEDLDLISRCAQRMRILTVPRPLGLYRVHGSAASFRTFHRMRAGTRFVRARIEARASGRELSWTDWVDDSSRRALREDQANFLYRSGAFQLVSGSRLRGVLNLVRAAAIAPDYVIRRLHRQISSGHTSK